MNKFKWIFDRSNRWDYSNNLTTIASIHAQFDALGKHIGFVYHIDGVPRVFMVKDTDLEVAKRGVEEYIKTHPNVFVRERL